MDYWGRLEVGSQLGSCCVDQCQLGWNKAEEMEGTRCLQDSEFLLTSYTTDLKMHRYCIYYSERKHTARKAVIHAHCNVDSDFRYLNSRIDVS